MTCRVLAIGLILAGAALARAAEPPHNILWDGGFEIGYGNTFWGVLGGNYGPNLRSMWDGGVVKLHRPIGSRIYRLPEGPYHLCAWVRRGPQFERQPARVTLTLSNRNYVRERKSESYSQTFDVPPGEGWHRVGFTLEVRSPQRPLFHVEVAPSGPAGFAMDADVLVDAVSLTPGREAPESVRPVCGVEAGFRVPEETGVYVDGEERVVELVVRNHGAAGIVRVNWEIFNHREESVRKGRFDEEVAAATTARRRMPVADLPWGGYRFACDVPGAPVLGDALVALLPRIDQDAPPRWGAFAAVHAGSRDCTARLMQRLGMKYAFLMSAAQPGRWSGIEREPGKYTWDDFPIDMALKHNLDPIVYLEVLKKPPPWVAKAMDGAAKVTDEAAYTEAMRRYAEAFARHFKGRVNCIFLEDEVAWSGPMDSLARIVAAGRDAIRGVDPGIKVGVNSDIPFWEKMIPALGPERVDVLSQNAIATPAHTAKLLRTARQLGWTGETADCPAVGQRSVPRCTSLIIDAPSVTGMPPGGFLWQHLLTVWLNRPYGTEDPRHGPILRTGYYDLRCLSACLHYPQGGKSGAEYDNSPSRGFQAVAMMKHILTGMRPARDPARGPDVDAEPTGTPEVQAIPFRNDTRAIVALLARNMDGNDRRWTVTGMDFAGCTPLDIYAQPLPAEGRTLTTPELPMYLSLPAERLPAVLAALKRAEFKPDPSAGRRRFEIGRYRLDTDAASPNLFQLRARVGGRELLLIDGVEATPPWVGAEVEVIASRLGVNVNFALPGGRDPHRTRGMTLDLSEEGCRIVWNQTNAHTTTLDAGVRLRLGADAAGRTVAIQENREARAGVIRADLSGLDLVEKADAVNLSANASRVRIAGFAGIDLAASAGQGRFLPASGFRWSEAGGKAALEAQYQIGPVPVPGSTAALQKISLGAWIVAAEQ